KGKPRRPHHFDRRSWHRAKRIRSSAKPANIPQWISIETLSGSPIAPAKLRESMSFCATDNELVRNILLALLSSLAKLEEEKISERTKAGMARAKTNGVKIGRPKLKIEIRQKIAQRARRGETPYAIAKALGIDKHTAAKYARIGS